MINKLINRIFKPDFVAIGNVVFRRDEIMSVGISKNLTHIIITYRDANLEHTVLECANKEYALEHMKHAASTLGLKLIKER